MSGVSALPTTASPFVWAGGFSVLAGLLVAGVAWRQRDTRGARTYAILMGVVSVWSALYVVQLLQPTVSGKELPFTLRHALTPLIAGLFWLFGSEFTDRSELLSVGYTLPIALAGGVLTLAPLVNPGGLYYGGLSLYTAPPLPRLVIEFGPAFWVMALYVTVVVGGCHIYFVATLLDSFSVYRRQVTAMAAVGTIEFALMFVFLSEHVEALPDLNPWPHVQLITYNMAFVSAPLGWSYLRQSLFDLQILDRQTVIENMEDAVFVFDTYDVLRNVNDAGAALTALDDPQGVAVAEVFDANPVLLEAYKRDGLYPATSRDPDDRAPEPLDAVVELGDGAGTSDSVELAVDGDSRWYDIRVSPIENSVSDRTGTVVVARDVTQRRRRRQMLDERTEELRRKTERLQRQNERLDQFAGVVSHDLRNPLMVISTHLDVLREDAPEENVEAIERSLDRMEGMIDDLLAMARAGQTVESTEPVALADVARTAWGHVEAPDSTLRIDVPGECTVQADHDRLLHVFENLFRNAVDHNEPPLTVRVGRIDPMPTSTRGSVEADSGFFVEDDGSNVPEDERDAVFDHGYTTSDDGTGLGLSIVQDMVGAHGWRIELTDGTDGGARFEITGVETGPQE